MHNIHNVFHIRLSLFLKQLDMNEEDILRINDELLLRRSFILETVLSFIYPSTILLILFTNICFCSSYPGQCIRKCSSFSIFPDLQTVQNLPDVGIFLCSFRILFLTLVNGHLCEF
jgi:hypothetical protein